MTCTHPSCERPSTHDDIGACAEHWVAQQAFNAKIAAAVAAIGATHPEMAPFLTMRPVAIIAEMACTAGYRIGGKDMLAEVSAKLDAHDRAVLEGAECS